MPVVGQLKVELTAETVKFSRPVQDASRDLETLGKKAQEAGSNLEKLSSRAAQIGRTLSLSVTAPLAAIGGAAIKMAMDAVESENLFEVSMGKMADAARKWSEELRQQLGLNAYEVRKQVGTFNVMLTSMGLGEQAAYGMAKGLTQLAYDMSSFYNLKPEEAFLKLQAAIAGEIEPLRRLGVNINEATVQAYALKTGLIEQGEQLSETGKAVARYGAIMEQMGKAHGDLARTIESPANQLRMLQSEVKQVAIDFGMALLPAFKDALIATKPLVDKLKELVAWFTALPPSTQETIVKLTALAAACGPIALALSGISKVAALLVAGVGTLIAVGGKLAFAFAAWAGGAATLGEAIGFLAAPAGPILLTVAAIGALIAAGYALYKHWDDVRHYALQAWGYIKLAVLEAADKILAAQQKLFGWLPTVGDAIASQRKQIQAMITDEMAAITERNAKREADAVAEQTKRALLARWGAYQDLMEKATGKTPEQPAWLKDLLAALSESGGLVATPSKATRTVADVLADLQTQLKVATGLASAFVGEYDLLALKTDALKSAIEELIRLGLDPQSEAVRKLVEQYEKLRDAMKPPLTEWGISPEAYRAKMMRVPTGYTNERWVYTEEELAARAAEIDIQLYQARDKRYADYLAKMLRESHEDLMNRLVAEVTEWNDVGRAAQFEKYRAKMLGAPLGFANDLAVLTEEIFDRLLDEVKQWNEEVQPADFEKYRAKMLSVPPGYTNEMSVLTDDMLDELIDEVRFWNEVGRPQQNEKYRAKMLAAPQGYSNDLAVLTETLLEGLLAEVTKWNEEVRPSEFEKYRAKMLRAPTGYTNEFSILTDDMLSQLMDEVRFWNDVGRPQQDEKYRNKMMRAPIGFSNDLAVLTETIYEGLLLETQRWNETVRPAEFQKYRSKMLLGGVMPGMGQLTEDILNAYAQQTETTRPLEAVLGIGTGTLEAQVNELEGTIRALATAMLKAGMSVEQVKAVLQPLTEQLNKFKDAMWRAQTIAQLTSSLLSGLADGLAEAGNAWTDFLSVVVSSIKLATDDAGNIIGVDWTTTLVNIANYGIRKLGEALGTLFGGVERLRKQYPGGAYGEVNYPDLARMRENYQNWERNFQALQQAQQAQAGMTVGGGLIGGFLGFLIGGPLGALIGAGLGAGVGYAAGQAAYGKQIEDLKKKLEDTFQKIAEALGTTISDIAGALGDAFSADTYQEFLSGFATNLESVVKQGLIKAFMAGEAMRPLLQGLSDFITTAVWDGVLDASEKLQLAQKFQEIVGVAQPFWEALQEFDFAEAVGGATDALNEFSEALRNVPTGYKIAAARWDVALPAYQEGGVVGRTGVAVLHAGETVIPAGEAGGIHVHLEGATIYGMDDFERKVEAAVSKAARRAGLGYRGLARAGAV